MDDGKSVVFRILGRRWRVSYDMAYRGTCLFIVVCDGPSAQVKNVEEGNTFGGFELDQGEGKSHVYDTGPGLYQVVISGGRDQAGWQMSVQDRY